MLSKIQVFRFVAIAVMFVSFLLTGCAAKKSTWGDPQTGLILHYNIQQDQVLNYKRSSESTQSMEMMGQSMKTTSNTSTDYIIKGAGMDGQNNIKTQVTINDLSINANSPQGPVSPDTSGLKGKSFGITFSPKGKETAFTGIDVLPKISMGQPNTPAQSAKDYFSNLLPELPADNFKIGDTWTTPIENNRKQGTIELSINGETINVLEGLETIQGMECVRIKGDTKSTIQGSGDMMGQEIKITGEAKATSTWYFAYKKGIFVRALVEEDSNMKINLGSMGEMPQSTKAKTTIELVQ